MFADPPYRKYRSLHTTYGITNDMMPDADVLGPLVLHPYFNVRSSVVYQFKKASNMIYRNQAENIDNL